MRERKRNKNINTNTTSTESTSLSSSFVLSLCQTNYQLQNASSLSRTISSFFLPLINPYVMSPRSKARCMRSSVTISRMVLYQILGPAKTTGHGSQTPTQMECRHEAMVFLTQFSPRTFSMALVFRINRSYSSQETKYGCAHSSYKNCKFFFSSSVNGFFVSSASRWHQVATTRTPPGFNTRIISSTYFFLAISQALKETNGYVKSIEPFSDDFQYCDHLIAKDILEHIEYEHIDKQMEILRSKCETIFAVIPLGDGKKYLIPAYELDKSHHIRESKEWWHDKFKKAGFFNINVTTELGPFKANWAEVNSKGNLLVIGS